MTAVNQSLASIANSSDGVKAVAESSYYGMTEAEKADYTEKGYFAYQGKVRELLRKDDSLYIFHTDRLTAFDKYIGMVPYKGLILAEISRFWLNEIADIVPNHFDDMVNERVIKAKNCKPVKAEVIVRGYMAGSMQRAYHKGVRTFCGAQLEDGLVDYQKLPTPIITPTTKAAAFEHDEDATPKELIEQGVCTEEEWAQISDLALALFARGQQVYEDRGWILVDTKYEFGWDKNGKICVIDEVHTPDSSRLWVRDSYQQRLAAGNSPEMLDKEIVREFLMEKGYSGEGEVPEVPAEVLVSLSKVYLKVAETLTGAELQTKLLPSEVSL